MPKFYGELETEEREKEAFREWLKNRHWEPISLRGDWRTGPYKTEYEYWREYIKPAIFPKSWIKSWYEAAPAEYLSDVLVSRTDYEGAVRALLDLWVDQGLLSKEESDVEFNLASQQARSQGVSPYLPYYEKALGPIIRQQIEMSRLEQAEKLKASQQEQAFQLWRARGAYGNLQDLMSAQTEYNKAKAQQEQDLMERERWEEGYATPWTQAGEWLQTRQVGAGNPYERGGDLGFVPKFEFKIPSGLNWIDQWFAEQEKAQMQSAIAQAGREQAYSQAREARAAGIAEANTGVIPEVPGGEGFQEQPIMPKAPPTPQWLSQFVPSLQAGQPIEKIAPQYVTYPTARAVSPTEWEDFQAYLTWAGQPDVWKYQRQIESMLPAAQPAQPRWRIPRY